MEVGFWEGFPNFRSIRQAEYEFAHYLVGGVAEVFEGWDSMTAIVHVLPKIVHEGRIDVVASLGRIVLSNCVFEIGFEESGLAQPVPVGVEILYQFLSSARGARSVGLAVSAEAVCL